MKKFLVCYSGGVSSAESALSIAARHGSESLILLNHNITGARESESTKAFKLEVADYLGVGITYANHDDWEVITPVRVCVDAQAWKVGNGQILCTNRLKTDPFKKWLKKNDPEKTLTVVYGFDKNEPARIARRTGIMHSMGYKTEYPMLWAEDEIVRISDIGIEKPRVYEIFKHANCVGCLKAGWQHWYIVYCTRPDVWEEAKWGEYEIGYAIHSDETGAGVYLEDKEELFDKMMRAGVEPTEHVKPQAFWAAAKKAVMNMEAGIHQLELELTIMESEDIGVCIECMA